MAHLECDYCSEECDENKLVILECDHKCCEYIEITSTRAEILGTVVIEDYINKRRESEAADKLYCSRPQFISPVHNAARLTTEILRVPLIPTWKRHGDLRRKKAGRNVMAVDIEAQVAEDAEAQEFMEMMEDTTQVVIGGGHIIEMRQYLERLQIAQQGAEHPDWWQPYIDDIQDELVHRQNEDLIWF
ncbi:hypothetical protein SLS62_003429 [Diatrype stigma]|uniref:Uncharacterized protein n=1 Tax=Diatrype stigma TaxID=117547 RepID=A0AAN9UYJ9_9PEZI